MQISLEISLYPLDQQYGLPILEFLDKLRQRYPALDVTTTTMSTQIFGEYDEVMPAVVNEMKTVFSTDNTVVMVMKIVNQDLR
jgi:uncharacterized protein YqgV (UPF0045/DUF77 family)